MRIDRSRREGPDRFLPLRLGAFFMAAALFGVGVFAGIDWLVLAAVGVGAAGWLLRFAGGRPRGPDRHPDWGGDEPDPPR